MRGPCPGVRPAGQRLSFGTLDDNISILAQAKAPHENGKTSPPIPRPGGERLLKERLVLERGLWREAGGSHCTSSVCSD